jgi:hypothetical protein
MPATVVSLKNAGGKVELNFKGGKAPFQAHLIYTTETLPVNEKFYMGKPYINGNVRKWQTLPATVKDGKITTQIPAEAVFSFIRLTDDEGPVSFLLK